MGVLIGTLMGLTGVGGGILAVPIFFHVMGLSLKEATLFSLITVILATGLNWITQRKHTDFSTAWICALFSIFSSRLTAPIKESAPDSWIKGVFVCICAFAIYMTWSNQKKKKIEPPKDSALTAFLKKSGFGLIIGALATFTGISGGVVLLPLLTHFLGFSALQAVSTNLLALHLTAWASLHAQIDQVREIWDPVNVSLLAVGCLASTLIVRNLIRHLKPQKLEKLRFYLYLGVVFIALISMFF